MRRGRTWRFRWPGSGSECWPLTLFGSDLDLVIEAGTGSEPETLTPTELEKMTESDLLSSEPASPPYLHYSGYC